MQENQSGGNIEVKRSLCEMCGENCGVEVHVKNGEILKIIGDKFGRSKGFRCEKNILGALAYHNHANRINFPLKRIGARGENKWQRITWKEALDDIAGNLGRIRNSYGPEAVAIMTGTGSTRYHWIETRWANLFGTPNRYMSTMNCFAPQAIVECSIYGSDVRSSPMPGLTHLAIFFSANQSRSRPQFWPAIRKAKAQGMKIVAIDPRYTEIAEIADMWLQIRPGTDAALMYGMLNVIIQEQLYDKGFVEKWCLGFDELKSCVNPYTPEVVQGITWIPRDKIVEIARLYATAKPAQLCSAWGVTYSHLGKDVVLQFSIAKSALRAITGNLDVKGGDFLRAPAAEIKYLENMHWDNLINHPLRKRDSLSSEKFPYSSVRGFKMLKDAMSRHYDMGGYKVDWGISPNVSPSLLWQAILEEKPYPLKALIVSGVNPMCVRPNPKRICEAFMSNKLELLVNVDHFMRPQTILADYVLPSADWLEGYTFSPMTYQSSEQAVSPKFERKMDYEFWSGLAISLGLEGYWPEKLEDMYDKLLEPTGYKFKEWASMTASEKDAIYPTRFKKYETCGFTTASGKVELVPSVLKKLGYDVMIPYREPVRSPISTPELAKHYPYILITGGRTMTYMHSRLREIEKLRIRHPDPIVQIHPDTARIFGIESGDWVNIETPEGKIKQKAEVTAGIHPKVVHVEHGWSFPEQPAEYPSLFGIWSSNAGVILSDDPELCDFQGGPALRALLCKISRT